MEVSRLVTLTYISTFVLAFVLFDKTLKWAWESFEFLSEFAIIEGILTLTSLLAIGLAAGLVYWMYQKREIYAHLSEVIIELKKVTWPGFSETKRSTMVVIVFSVILAFYLWGADRVFERLTDIILSSGV